MSFRRLAAYRRSWTRSAGLRAEESSEDVLRAIDRQARAVESARLEVMAFIAAIPDARVRAIAVMRFLEGKSWETIARRMHYERTSPAKQLRRFLRARM